MTERNPLHPGEVLRDPLDEAGWTIQEFADKLGVSRNTRLPPAERSLRNLPNVALALERIGWSNADFWMRIQASYYLAAARRALTVKS